MSVSLLVPNSVQAQMLMTKSVSSVRPSLGQKQDAVLRKYYDALFAAFGPQHWWPGHSRFEIIVGAILTQSTSWANVELAIRNLRAARLLTPSGIERVSLAKLARLIRPSGYFRQKSK